MSTARAPARTPARTLVRTAAPLALLALAGCSSSEPPEVEPLAGLSTERSCFFTRSINGYNEAPSGPRGGERLWVHTGVNERFLIETYGPCPDLDWSFSIALDTRAQTSLCTGDIATVVVPRTIGGVPDRCTARVLGRMSQAPGQGA